MTKFRPPALPDTLISRLVLHDRLAAGSGQRLTVVVGSAGAGKSVLLADWAAGRLPGMTSWLSCDKADADAVRFWTAFIEAPRAIEPGFGADAADLLAMDRTMSADVTASVANDVAELPAGSAIVVDDFHYAAAAAAPDMTDLIERWPSETVQLVLAGRFDPPLRQHRLRMSGQLAEICWPPGKSVLRERISQVLMSASTARRPADTRRSASEPSTRCFGGAAASMI